MPLKTDTETAVDKVGEDGGDTLKLTDLPVEALALITSQSFTPTLGQFGYPSFVKGVV